MPRLRWIGMILMGAGFVGAAFATVYQVDGAGLEWNTVQWVWYVPAFIIGVAGVVALRVVAHTGRVQTHRLDSDWQSVTQSLSAIKEQLNALINQRDQISVYDISAWIDDRLALHLGEFVEARNVLIHRYGLRHYADVMSRFASGERMINRAWSASVDGYIDETWQCLQSALTSMHEAHDRLMPVTIMSSRS